MKRSKPIVSFQPAPHANAAAHKLVMGRLSGMSAEEVFGTVVEAGICTPGGILTSRYQISGQVKGKKTRGRQPAKRPATV